MKPLFLVAVMAPFWLVSMPSAVAAEPPYLDDRSSPEALVRSLYNAISRKEYARAYAYFDPPPADTLDAYADGYADTASVDVATGIAAPEGAAGSIFYALPVAVRARTTDGAENVFAGCYELRFIQPSVQSTPYRPLFIAKGQLASAEGSLEDALPASCGDGPQPEAGELLLERAKRLFAAVYGEVCRSDDFASDEGPESHVIRFNYPSEPEGAPQNEARLFRFFCDRGAYNELHAYLLANENGALLPLRFATPELDIRYENDDRDGRVEEMRIIGYTADDLLVNSDFDPQTLEIASHSKWRGVGDASSTGIWLFRSGTFTLVKYDVDASYDGEINPEPVIDFHSGP